MIGERQELDDRSATCAPGLICFERASCSTPCDGAMPGVSADASARLLTSRHSADLIVSATCI